MEAMEKVVGEVEEFLEGVGRVVGEEGEKGGREVESFEKFLKVLFIYLFISLSIFTLERYYRLFICSFVYLFISSPSHHHHQQQDTNPKNGWKDSVGFEVFAVYCQLKEEGGSGGEGGEGGNKEIEGGYLCARAGGEVEVVKKGEGEGFMREELWTFHRQIFRLVIFYFFFVTLLLFSFFTSTLHFFQSLSINSLSLPQKLKKKLKKKKVQIHPTH